MKNKTDTLNKVIQKPKRLTLKEGRNVLFEKFRRNLRMLRGSQSLSGIELADKLSLRSGKRVIDLEYGRTNNPTVEELQIIADHFKVSLDDLLKKDAIIKFE